MNNNYRNMGGNKYAFSQNVLNAGNRKSNVSNARNFRGNDRNIGGDKQVLKEGGVCESNVPPSRVQQLTLDKNSGGRSVEKEKPSVYLHSVTINPAELPDLLIILESLLLKVMVIVVRSFFDTEAERTFFVRCLS